MNLKLTSKQYKAIFAEMLKRSDVNDDADSSMADREIEDIQIEIDDFIRNGAKFLANCDVELKSATSDEALIRVYDAFHA